MTDEQIQKMVPLAPRLSERIAELMARLEQGTLDDEGALDLAQVIDTYAERHPDPVVRYLARWRMGQAKLH